MLKDEKAVFVFFRWQQKVGNSTTHFYYEKALNAYSNAVWKFESNERKISALNEETKPSPKEGNRSME